MEFKLPYYVSNGGDGSVSVHFMPDRTAAEKADADMDEGWGESSAGEVTLKVENRTLFFQDYDCHKGWIWIPVQQLP